MKKYLILLSFFVLLMISLTGCHDPSLDEETDVATSITKAGTDVDFSNVTVTSNRTVSASGNITSRNVTVNDNVQLTLQASQKIIISGTFRVNSKAKLRLSN